MAYSVELSVQQWTQNIETSSPGGLGGLYDQASAICDVQIDADLGNFFFWPANDQDVLINNPPPPYIVQMANVLTASICENMAYSQMQSKTDASLDDNGGFGGSTYGRMLYGMYKNMLQRLIKGQAFVYQLSRYGSIGMVPGRGGIRVEMGLAYDEQLGNETSSAITANQGDIISIQTEDPNPNFGEFDSNSGENE